jgi:hypothetical protein
MSELPEQCPTDRSISTPALAGAPFIKRGDERLGRRYMQRDCPHAPAGAAPNSCRRERLVAFALRRRIDSVTASLIRGAAEIGARLCPGAPARPADAAA